MAAPLFLLAPPRSYTSLVNAMIGQHPQAFGEWLTQVSEEVAGIQNGRFSWE